MPLNSFAAFRQIVLSALITGVIVGILIGLLQVVATAPLIAAAEVYEQSELNIQQNSAAESAHTHAARHEESSEHDHHAMSTAQWQPEEGFERFSYTALTTGLAAFGYALIFGALLGVIGAAGLSAGLTLGVIGFIIFQLAPAIGLPPRPPGTPVADLQLRQIWWLGTVATTALAFSCGYLAWRRSKPVLFLLGIVLLVIPHLVGAPIAPTGSGLVPDHLVRRFAWMALITGACFWGVLGISMGLLNRPKAEAHKNRSPQLNSLGTKS